MFPSNFDLNIYIKHADLKFMNNKLLEKHYKEYGKNEGRICSKISNRTELIKYIDTNKLKCLEIGPFDCPNLKGGKVKYFDVLDQDSLKKRALKLNRKGKVPYIDYVNNKGDLRIIDEKFDLVLSCHSIEHQLNFIQHLRDVSELLNDNGYYVIILPDKRYCFDHFIKESTIADIICQYTNKPKLHSIKSVIEHRALTCHNNSNRHWNNDHGKQTYFSNTNSIMNAIKEYQNSISNNQYLDVHSLQFTPDSFKNIINLLNQLNYIDLVIDNFYNTIKNSCEFFVILKKLSK
jgi:hypothetical protein